MQRRMIATLSMLMGVHLIAADLPASSACDDGISASASISDSLDSPFFHESKSSLNWWMVEGGDGKLEDTLDGEIGPDDLVRIEHTANCTSTHQGEHLMEFGDAVRDGDRLRLSLHGGMPAYASSLSLTIDPSLVFRCDFSSGDPVRTGRLQWKITKKELQLRSRNLEPGQRLYGWISVTFEETDGAGERRTYKIEGYIKPVIQHKPA